MYIPTIGTKGKFTFLEPFDSILSSDQEYTVEALRSLSDLTANGEKPYEGIYKTVGISTEDFISDLENDIFIVTFKTTGGENYYIPSNKINSIPITNGVKYQDMLVVANLGAMPVEFNTTLLLSTVAEDIYNTTGIKTDVVIVNNSAINYKSNDEHSKLTSIRENITTTTKSYKTKYLEAMETINVKNKYINELENMLTDL